MNLEKSLYTSSVYNYRNHQLPNNNHKKNFVSYLHSKNDVQTKPYSEQNYEIQTPILRRNRSYNMFPQKPYDQTYYQQSKFNNKSPEKKMFQSSLPTGNYTDFHNLKKQMTDIKARQIQIDTQRQLLVKQNMRLKEQIKYLNQKCRHLQQKNEELIKNQSKLQILERQYTILAQKYKRQQINQVDTSHFILPMTLDYKQTFKINQQQSKPYKRFQQNRFIGKQQVNRQSPFNQMTQKVNLKKVSGVSPIYKLQNLPKQPTNFSLQSFLQSKIKNRKNSMNDSNDYIKINEGYDNNKYIFNNLNKIEVDKYKQLEYRLNQIEEESRLTKKQVIQILKQRQQSWRRLRQVQNQKQQLERQRKDVAREKQKYQQLMNNFIYEKSKQSTSLQFQQDHLKKQLQQNKIAKQQMKIIIIQLNENIANQLEQIKLLKIEKEQLSADIQAKTIKQNDHIKNMTMNLQEMTQKYAKIQQNYNSNKQNFEQMTHKVEILEKENADKDEQIQQKQTIISNLQNKIRQLEQRSMINEKQNNAFLPSNSNNISQEQPQIKHQQIQTDLCLEQMNNFIKQTVYLRQQHGKYILCLQENSFLRAQHKKYVDCAQQLQKVKKQTVHFIDDHARLTRQLNNQKIQNIKLHQLQKQWRDIEAKIKMMKKIDLGVDHLWSIKEVQYNNIHQLLNKLNQQ